jgi:hypothetical protein
MRPSGGARPRVSALPTAGLAAIIGVIVFGILAMHALGTHGLGMHGTSMSTHLTAGHAPAMTPAAHVGSHSAAMADAVGSPLRAVAATTDSAAETGAAGGGPGMPDMVMLCFAMLAAAAGILLLVSLLRRLPQQLFGVPTRRGSRFLTGWSGWGNGPPYVWDFSVIRC